jgi:hypothetical protein
MDEMMVARKESRVMRTKAIANAIEKDLLDDRPQSQHQSQLCFACGRSYCHGDSRFCSPRCRSAFDAGAPPHGESEPRRSTYTWPNGRPMQARGDGFAIECKDCGHEVISKGLRCCSDECERAFREREKIAATMAEVGMEHTPRRKCEECGGEIPRYQGTGKARRETRKDARFCARRCAENSRKLQRSTGTVLRPIEA